MILKYFGKNLNPQKWEELCDSCYMQRYQKENYQKIPASSGGDAGIEGFTRSGVVYQCYFPDKQYSDNEYYEHLRKKATDDLNKLKTNIKRLKELGVTYISEWHFVIPEYRDSRILKHLNTKRLEIKSLKLSAPQQYDIISDDFDIIIKTAEDFSNEIYRYILHDISEEKIKIDFIRENNIDITKCDSSKVANVKRKIKEIMLCDENDENFKLVVEAYINSYMKGLEILQELNTAWPAGYQEIYDLMEAYKNKVHKQSLMNSDKSVNKELFSQIMDNFKCSLKDVKGLSEASQIELCDDIIAGWLADCNLEFKE